ncbi:histidine kinase [Eggerthellaceae bacterium zg-1084]|uniref:ATP-binding protein n=1 Tax=Berryella wangjianweii TaxID=2734634 RepID=UPI001555F7FB|nr:ATP-binding protein [Berryella wangjianweii]NPD30939.1 histidine kinase [Berryella wangjianweii]NPD31804.1 histidine kinase [Eggerthellaceae bacterium zg-997]
MTTEPANFDYVSSTARIAIYDNLRSTPRVVEIPPAPTNEYITSIATQTYTLAREMGGQIPFTVVQEVSENFIHAYFTEVVVSVLDGGNTIRFTDQGPGIPDCGKAQLPGYSSAVEEMKRYIRGVGSGLPIVKEYFEGAQGSVVIENNIRTGAVVTISLKAENEREEAPLRQALRATQRPASESGYPNEAAASGATNTAREVHAADSTSTNATSGPLMDSMPILSPREQEFIELFYSEGPLGVTEMGELTNTAPSTTHVTMKKLVALGLIEVPAGTKKRVLTARGRAVAQQL